MSPREALERLFASELGLERRPSGGGRRVGYFAGPHEVAHFHGELRLDVRLTRAVIGRKKAEHALDARVRTRGPSADWVSVTLSGAGELDLPLDLVRQAIQTAEGAAR